MSTFIVPSFAKINLSLRVLGRRETDGYHELETIFQIVSLRDDLIFSERSDNRVELVCDKPHVPTDESNLIHRAAVALRNRFNLRKGARIELIKRIPVGGGLGGGSSNAAVALMGLARLWRIESSFDELVETGAKLGADVPFFFTGGTALGTGTGIEITPLEDVEEQHLLIITPDEKVSTADAYRALRAPFLTKPEGVAMLPSSRAGSLNMSLEDVLHNDFEPVTFSLHPQFELAKRELVRHGARGALLSGSGASVFGIFDNGESQRRAHDVLKRRGSWQSFVCTTLKRAAYLEALGVCRSFSQS
ncbi:MAG: 4-(cytidine 5'-diphospho)-2-C-methyl-D-erythritol kinase [Pyrinomonadaceae bacterium]|nr:4-(cytidine 5'-diphospho)-2-C-methyl-D-erythritol kinase [Pyrinomonadaceae bacterium]